MINPQALPSLPLAMSRGLPHCPAIYFVLDGEEVAYIGRSRNLNNRWIQHHRRHQLSDDCCIAWLELSDESLLDETERALIEWFQPKLNRSEVTTDRKRVTVYLLNETKEWLESAAKENGRSISNYIERILFAMKEENLELEDLKKLRRLTPNRRRCQSR